MRKYCTMFALIALFITPLCFADTDPVDTDMKECKVIADACKQAGYDRKAGPGKAFWHDCMKPILWGQTASGVTIAANDVSACRQAKITKMQTELQQLQQVQSQTK